MTRSRVFICALLTAALSRFGAAAQGPSASAAAAVAANIERELRAAAVPGGSFAIVSGDQVMAGHYGLADVERGIAMTAATLLQVGWLNKLMTALALVRTLDQQKIPLDEQIGQHVPGLSPKLAAVTFHQLLSQTSGLRDHASTMHRCGGSRRR